jgi:cytochrome c-type biogenesis protein
MIARIFSFFTHILDLGPLFALCAALGWGVLSILLSPCHLTSIPLVIGYLTGQKGLSSKKVAGTVLVFSFGILFTVGVIGLVTYSMGRLVGDLGSWGNYLVGAIFIFIGLYLIGVLKMPAVGVNVGSGPGKGYLGALVLGLLCGFALGPCTFAYLAPILGVVFRKAASSPGFAGLLLASYAVGHTAVILLAGLLYGRIERCLNWAADERRGGLVKKLCGFLILAGGLYLLSQAMKMTVFA